MPQELSESEPKAYPNYYPPPPNTHTQTHQSISYRSDVVLLLWFLNVICYMSLYGRQHDGQRNISFPLCFLFCSVL